MFAKSISKYRFLILLNLLFMHAAKLELKEKGLEFWTSGSNEGESCNAQNVYSWCSATNVSTFEPEFLERVQNKFFRNLIAKDAANDRCVTFKLNASNTETSGFEHAACNKSLNYICEVFFKYQ
jgi:hypothetical protein